MRLLVCSLCLLVQLAAAAPSHARGSQAPAPGWELVNGKTSFGIPFELVDNRIFIGVMLNGRGPYRFILDMSRVAERPPGQKFEPPSTSMTLPVK